VKRRLFNLAARLSLVLCVATVGLWVRSYSVVDVVGRHEYTNSGNRQEFTGWAVASNRGRVLFSRQYRLNVDAAFANDPGRHVGRLSHRTQPAIAFASWFGEAGGGLRFLGFAFRRVVVVDGPDMTRDSSLGLPIWTLCASTAAPPVWWWLAHLKRVRRFRAEHNLCLKCGYDLRASKDCCAECGTPIATEAAG
jgi:hypothetical protein